MQNPVNLVIVNELFKIKENILIRVFSFITIITELDFTDYQTL